MSELKFGGVLIGSADAEKLTAFYRGVFGEPTMQDDGGFAGWALGTVWFSVVPHSEVTGSAAEPQRVILNLETPEVQAEFERIRDTGAAVVKEPYELEGMQIATFADPDGNYFQLMAPWEGAPEANA